MVNRVALTAGVNKYAPAIQPVLRLHSIFARGKTRERL